MDEAAQCAAGEDQRKKQIEQNLQLMTILWTVAERFDFGELRYALTDIAAYRGLVLVDIHAADGTIVHISL